MSNPSYRQWQSELIGDPDAQASAIAETSVIAGWPADPDEGLRRIVADLDHLPDLRVFAAVFDDYGSGFASFVEVKLTRRDDSLVEDRNGGIEIRGFGVLLNRLAPVAALQTDVAQWTSGSSGSATTLPSRSGLTASPVNGFPESAAVATVLAAHGYEIADPALLNEPIAQGLAPNTNLADGPWTAFDAWFYWYD